MLTPTYRPIQLKDVGNADPNLPSHSASGRGQCSWSGGHPHRSADWQTLTATSPATRSWPSPPVHRINSTLQSPVHRIICTLQSPVHRINCTLQSPVHNINCTLQSPVHHINCTLQSPVHHINCTLQSSVTCPSYQLYTSVFSHLSIISTVHFSL